MGIITCCACIHNLKACAFSYSRNDVMLGLTVYSVTSSGAETMHFKTYVRMLGMMYCAELVVFNLWKTVTKIQIEAYHVKLNKQLHKLNSEDVDISLNKLRHEDRRGQMLAALV